MIDKQRIAAATTLQALRYTFSPTHGALVARWLKPHSSARRNLTLCTNSSCAAQTSLLTAPEPPWKT